MAHLTTLLVILTSVLSEARYKGFMDWIPPGHTIAQLAQDMALGERFSFAPGLTIR